MNRVLVVCLLAALCAVAHGANWTVVQNKYVTVGMTCQFQTSTFGWLPGSRGDGAAAFFYTDDGGQTLKTASSSFSSGMPVAVAMVNQTYGVVGMVGMFSLLPSAAITVDGQTWNEIDLGKTIAAAYQGAAAAADGTLVLVGTWTNKEGSDSGIQISTDGKTWTQNAWNQGTVPARYASFLNSTTGWVSGGSWPDTNDTSVHHITRSLYLQKSGKFGVRMASMKEGENPMDGYTAVIAKTNDGGKTWTTQFNSPNKGIYFNAIDVVNGNNGWAVAEGVDQNGEPIAYIYATLDGGNTWFVQNSIQYGSLMTVSFTDNQNGWVGGVDLSTGSSLSLFTNNGGKTWTAANPIVNFFFTEISAVNNGTVAFGAGITRVGVSSLARFQ